MKKSVLSFILGLSVLTFGIFTSCEVGLGSAVDTEAPVPVFAETTVGSGAVIRDAFIVHGTWTDDGSIKELKATLSSTSGSHLAFKADGKVETQASGKGTWSVVFDPITDSIPDGSYELSITMTDTGKHSSTITRSLIIDNTAPLVVLSRPSTKKNNTQSFDSYGQKFTLEGKAADDNDVSLIEVNVYADADCSGSPLKTINLPNVPLTIETDVAEYEKDKVNDYSVIYGIVDANGYALKNGTTVERYCKLVVYDGAKRYPADGSAQTEDDLKGNKIDYYYLNADLAQLFTDGYKITELYHILNGSYSSSASRATSLDGVVQLLNSSDAQVKIGQFKLNPENSPHFVVSARNTLGPNQSLADMPITNGNSNLEVELTPGLDGHLIKKETVGVYLIRCDEHGNPLKTDGTAAATEDEAKKIWLIEVDKHDEQADITESGSTYKFKTKERIGNGIWPDMVVGENYYVGVVGKDMQGNSILCNGLYGFQLITSGKNIEVGIRSEPEWLSTKSLANSENKTVKVTLSYATDNKPFEILRDDVSIAQDYQTSPYEDTSLDISSFDATSETKTVVYKVKGDSSAESNPKTITLKYDNTEPQVEITDLPDTTATEQTTITFKGKASDKKGNVEQSGVKTVYVQIKDKTTPANATPAAGQTGAIKASYSGGEWLCQIKPEDYAETNGAFATEGKKTIIVTAVDGVGLKKEVTAEFEYDSAAPKITLTNYKLNGATSTSSFGERDNDFSLIVGKLFTLNGTLVEKYGLATNGFKIKQVYKSFDGNTTNTKEINMPTPAANGSWSIQLPFNRTNGNAYVNNTIVADHSADGTYSYTITAKDKVNKSDNDSIKFTAKLKTDGPALEITSPEFNDNRETKNWQKTHDIMVSGKASSPATVSKIYWTTDSTAVAGTWTEWNESTKKGWKEAEGQDNWNFTVSVDSDSASHEIWIAAVDSLGNKTTKIDYTLKVDSTAPDMAPKYYKIGNGEIQPANGTIFVSGLTQNTLTVYGTWSEDVSGPYSGGGSLKPLAFTVNGTAKNPIIKYSNDDITSGVGSASFTASSATTSTKSWQAEFAADTSYTDGPFVVTARNGANLSRDNSDLSIQKDSIAPKFGDQISITKSSYDKKVTTAGVDTFYYYVNNKTATTISGSAEDANLLSVEIKATSSGKTPITDKITSNPYNWSFELNMTGWTADTDVLLTITDKAGNTTTKNLKFVFDTTPPLANHEWDKKNKDLYFRVGEANNELQELTDWDSTITTLDTEKDKNVGGKYLNGTFGNAETIRIRGDFNDAGSGLSAIYYKVFDAEPTATAINAFIASPDTEKTGSAIAPSDITQRVSYTDPSDNKKKFKSVHTSFSTLVSDLRANNVNYIVVVAVDKVGNVGLDYAEKSNYDGASSTKPYSAKAIKDSYYTLNIDTINVENTVDSNVDTNGYVNPALSSCPDITISGVATSGKDDAGNFPSVISDVFIELKVNGKRILVEDTNDSNYTANSANGKIVLDQSTSPYTTYNTHWTATIKPKVVFNGVGSGQYPVYAIVSDGAGNLQTFTVAQINIDKNAPTVKINNISDADKDTTDKLDVNGNVTIEGTVTEKESFNSVKIEYKKTTATSWTTLATKTDTTWSAELNTTSLSDTTEYDIRVTASDKAGNTGSASTKIYVNQDSDRPVVKFTNLTKDESGNYFLKYGDKATLEGVVSDDDAETDKVVTVFKASFSPITSATATASGTTNLTASSGDFKFTPATADQEDGEKTVYFYIKDNYGKEFYTTYTSNPAATSDKLKRPKQQYKTEAKEDNAAALVYKSDSNAPTINSVQLQAYTAASGNNTESGSATTLGASCIVGGENKKFVTLSVSAKDGNGIKGIVIELEQKTGTSTSVTKRYRSNNSVGTGTFAATGSITATSNINENHVYTTGRLNLASLGFTQNSASTVSDIKDGKVSVRVYVYDNSGLYSNQESLFVIDNTAPTLNITTPADGEQVYALQSNTVGGSVDGHTDVEKIYYAVTTTSTAPTTNATGTSTAGWHEIPDAKLSASVIFDGTGVGTTGTEGYHSDTLRAWLKTLTGKTDAQLNENDDRITVYIHFRVVDKCGNAGVTTKNVSAYPNGDKPVIELVYPEDKAGGATPSLAGTIRVYGYASVYIGTVAATYVQIDPTFETSFNATGWEAELTSLTTGKATYVVEDIGSTGLRGIKATGTQNWNLPINTNNEFNPSGNDSRHMAIRVYSLSDSGKVSEVFEQKFDVDPNAPHIGGDGTKDNLTDTAARQYSLQVVEFANVTDGADINITTNQNPVSYKTDMWVKGQKYLIASIYDDTGIKSLTLNENISGVGKINLVSFTGTGANQRVTINSTASLNSRNGGGHITVKESTCGYAAGTRNINIVIPLPTGTGSGSINWQIEATEDSDNNNSCTETIKINYDNSAPRLGMTDHSQYSIDPDIHQSNGFYTLKGYATDAEGDSNVSGMRSVAFYFMRRGTADTNPVTKVYDPMLQNSFVPVRTGSNDASSILYSHGLYWKTKTVTRDTTNLRKLTLSAVDSNIHPGGLALLGGNIYRIESVSGKDVILEDEVPATQTTANFALALVVDNLTKKETTTGRTIISAAGYGHGYYSALSSADDGDLMQEDWNGTSIEGQWTAIINSANIPDGPIELHYVAFDKAQNYAVGIVGNVNKANYEAFATKDALANKAITGATTDTTNKLASKYYYVFDSDKPAYISNNAPRIAGVTVGTDYNGDGNITDGSVVSGVATLNEKRSKYSGEADRYIGGTSVSNVQKKATGDKLDKIFLASANETTPMMIIKDKMSVDIEIIGGNGDLYYRYKVGSGSWTEGADAWVEGTDFTRNTNEGLTGVDAFSQTYYNTTSMPTLNFSETDIKNKTTDDGTVLWTFEIWDSTEERTPFDDSQNTTLKLPLDIQVRDGLRPNTVVSDLYWNSATDNSVYIDMNNKLHGHVELIKDLGSSQLGTTYGTGDDKVSGIVVFRGFAYDNKRLSQIDWAIVNSDGHSILPNNASGITYQSGPTFTSGTWSNGGSTGDLTYNTSTKTMTGTYKFTIKTAAADGAYLDDKGHKVAWELAVDTSKIDGVVASNAKLYVRAKDTSGSTTTQYTDMAVTGSAAAGETDQETIDKATKKPTYQVDILPYITGVTTRLAKMNKPDPVIYSRTAQGHYPISSNETAAGSVVLQGYNLASGNAEVDISSVIANRPTGAYAYTVSGTITTINNMNNNDAHGDYNISVQGLEEKTKVSNMYNRQPNTSTNLTLTDDVYFDIWQFTTGAIGMNGKIKEPVMRINPNNNVIGLAFATGPAHFSMPGSENTFELWQKNYADYNGIAMAYDYAGYAHTIAVGLDTEPNANYAGRMNYTNSAFGHTYRAGGTNYEANDVSHGNFQRRTQVALESIGGAGVLDQERFSDVSIAVGSASNGFPTVYIAYCDTNSGQIRFRYGTINNTTRWENQFDQINDSRHDNSTNAVQDDYSGGNNYSKHVAFDAYAGYYSLIAGTGTGNTADEYVAIDVISGTDENGNHSATEDIVVVVWYDGTDLKYMYRYGTKDDTDASSNGVTANNQHGGWSKPITIYEGLGSYCKVKADPAGGIHIACFDDSNSDLKYAYLSSYDSTTVYKATVDSYSQIGSNLELDVGRKTAAGNVIPYISYYAEGMKSLPKIAYLPNGIDRTSAATITASLQNGADPETNLYTGTWEISLLPTNSKVRNDNIQIALWKNKDTGVINYTPTSSVTAATASNSGSTIKPNGKSEVAVGYATVSGTTGYVEIAQRK